MQRRPRQRRIIEVLGIDGFVALSFWVLILGMVVAVGGQLRFNLPVMWEPLLEPRSACWCASRYRRPFWHGLAEWGPFVALIALYVPVVDPYATGPWASPRPRACRHGPLPVRRRPKRAARALSQSALTELMALGYSSYLILMLTVAPAYIPTVKG